MFKTLSIAFYLTFSSIFAGDLNEITTIHKTQIDMSENPKIKIRKKLKKNKGPSLRKAKALPRKVHH